MPSALFPVVQDDATTVNARSGRLPFFVSRSWALDAPIADLKARFSAPTGTSRLIIPVLEWRVYVVSSNMQSWVGWLVGFSDMGGLLLVCMYISVHISRPQANA